MYGRYALYGPISRNPTASLADAYAILDDRCVTHRQPARGRTSPLPARSRSRGP